MSSRVTQGILTFDPSPHQQFCLEHLFVCSEPHCSFPVSTVFPLSCIQYLLCFFFCFAFVFITYSHADASFAQYLLHSTFSVVLRLVWSIRSGCKNFLKARGMSEYSLEVAWPDSCWKVLIWCLFLNILCQIMMFQNLSFLNYLRSFEQKYFYSTMVNKALLWLSNARWLQTYRVNFHCLRSSEHAHNSENNGFTW